jgi:hypothetical protein
MSSTDKLARHVSQIRKKLARAQVEVQLLSAELRRAEERFSRSMAGNKVEAGKRG